MNEKDALPMGILSGKKSKQDKIVLWIHPKGIASLTTDGKPVPEVQPLLDAGFAILAPDVLGVGGLTLALWVEEAKI